MSGLSKLFLGFIFILFSFRLHGVDLLPAFLGFLVVYSGLGDLSGVEAGFAEAKRYSLPLFLVSLFFFVPLDLALVLMFLSVAYACMLIMMLRHICMAIAKLAGEQGLNDLAQGALNRWSAYAIITVLTLASPFLMFLGPVLMLLVVAGIVVSLLMVLLMRWANQSLDISEGISGHPEN